MLTKGDARKGDVKNGMLKLQAFLKAIMLRRVKGSLIDGKPIVVLPPKTEEIQHVVFDEDEQEFYNTLENKTKVQFSKYMRAGTVGKNYSNILVLLLRLRQACCHPHLITHFDEAVPVGSEISVDVQVELAKGLSPEVIARLTTTAGSFEVSDLPFLDFERKYSLTRYSVQFVMTQSLILALSFPVVMIHALNASPKSLTARDNRMLRLVKKATE